MRRRVTLSVALLIAGVVLGAMSLLSRSDQPQASAGATQRGPTGTSAVATAPTRSPGGILDAAISRAQVALRANPRDFATWAQLGSAYVQQARVIGDPSFLPKADGALAQSLAVQPIGNWQAAVGLGSLANARHEFRKAASWGRNAVHLNPYNANAYGVLNDAYTQLGDYPSATTALKKMLDLQPGIASFTRAEYEFEEHGQLAKAHDALQQALTQASDPADMAFCRYYLGELAFNSGQLDAAAQHFELGLEADAAFDPLLAGRAKVEGARGDISAAVRDYQAAVDRVPQPQYLLEYGELLQSVGRAKEAQVPFALLAVEGRLLAANGVVDDLSEAVFAADHGDPAAAVSHARAEWSRRHSVLVADALGWALHRSGRDGEALSYSNAAMALGWHNATFTYHRGMILLRLGDRAGARRDLAAALEDNPHFNPLQAPMAVRTLAELARTR